MAAFIVQCKCHRAGVESGEEVCGWCRIEARKEAIQLRFTVPGPLTSNNFVKTPIRYGRSIKTASARRDNQRVFQLSFAAAQTKGWEKPTAAILSIVAWNCRKDVGNIEKCIADGMIGAVYDDDRILKKLIVEKRVDAGEERYDVTVERCDPLPSRADVKKKARAT